MDKFIQSFVSAGLTDKEARVYIALLQLGKSSAYSIAEKAGIKKPTAYVILDDLIKKGLVLKIPRVKKQQFVAKSAEEFFASAEEALKQAKKILPELETLTQEKTKTRVLLFEGMKGVEDAMLYRMGELKNTRDVGFWAKIEGLSSEYIKLTEKWSSALKKQNVSLHGITPANPEVEKWMKKNNPLSKIHSVPESTYSAQVSIDVTEKFVRIADPHALQFLIIENDRIAHAFKQILNMIMEKFETKTESGNS